MAAPVIIEAALNGGTHEAYQSARAEVHRRDRRGRDRVPRRRRVDHPSPQRRTGARRSRRPRADSVCGQSGVAYARDTRKRSSIRRWQAAAHDISIERRYAHIEALAATDLLDLGLVDPGTTNIGRFDADGAPRAESTRLSEHVRRCGLHDRNVSAPRDLGIEHLDLRTGIRARNRWLSARGATTARRVREVLFRRCRVPDSDCRRRRTALDAYLEMLREWPLPWLVSIQGGDLIASTEFARYVIERGGHLQVGLEPNPDRARGNVELVSAAAHCAPNSGDRPASSCSRRVRFLGLKARDQFCVGVIW